MLNITLIMVLQALFNTKDIIGQEEGIEALREEGQGLKVLKEIKNKWKEREEEEKEKNKEEEEENEKEFRERLKSKK